MLRGQRETSRFPPALFGREPQRAPRRARAEPAGERPSPKRAELKPFRYGMPPHGGFGLGIDRLTMEVLGLPNVREAVLFPRDRNRLAP